MESVSWSEVTSFCSKLTASERAAGRLPAGMTYQLPKEAQCEYACRAGAKTAFAFENSLTSGQANISGGPGETTAVGEYPANGWGFYDMHGNVWEWCADRYGDYPAGAARDPVGPADDSRRVLRSGSWIRCLTPVPRRGSGTSPPTAATFWASASLSDHQQASSGVRCREQYSLQDVEAIATRLPGLKIIIDHFGNFRVDGEPLDPQWVTQFKSLARRPNIYCKVSALYGRVKPHPAPKKVSFYRPILELAYDAFGEDRLVYGSDWPVTETTGDYKSVLKLTRAWAATKGDSFELKLFYKNAVRFYGIPKILLTTVPSTIPQK